MKTIAALIAENEALRAALGAEIARSEAERQARLQAQQAKSK